MSRTNNTRTPIYITAISSDEDYTCICAFEVMEFPGWAIVFVVLSTVLPFISSFVHRRIDVRASERVESSEEPSLARTCSLHWYFGKRIDCIGGNIKQVVPILRDTEIDLISRRKTDIQRIFPRMLDTKH